MREPKNKKKKRQEDTDYTDEIGGGLTEESPPLTREGFYKILHKVIKPLSDKPSEEKSGTSE